MTEDEDTWATQEEKGRSVHWNMQRARRRCTIINLIAFTLFELTFAAVAYLTLTFISLDPAWYSSDWFWQDTFGAYFGRGVLWFFTCFWLYLTIRAWCIVHQSDKKRLARFEAVLIKRRGL